MKVMLVQNTVAHAYFQTLLDLRGVGYRPAGEAVNTGTVRR